jgi:hypothetical protein
MCNCMRGVRETLSAFSQQDNLAFVCLKFICKFADSSCTIVAVAMLTQYGCYYIHAVFVLIVCLLSFFRSTTVMAVYCAGAAPVFTLYALPCCYIFAECNPFAITTSFSLYARMC